MAMAASLCIPICASRISITRGDRAGRGTRADDALAAGFTAGFDAVVAVAVGSELAVDGLPTGPPFPAAAVVVVLVVVAALPVSVGVVVGDVAVYLGASMPLYPNASSSAATDT